MNHRLVFNHHSLPFPSAAQADAAIRAFLELCLKAQRLKFSVILVDEELDASWFRIELAKDYFWQDCHDRHRHADRDLFYAFLQIATDRPFSGAADKEQMLLCEVHLPNSSESLIALQAAKYHEAPLLSFPTRPPWTASPVVAVVERLTAGGEMESARIGIRNLYDPAGLEVMRQEQSDNIRSGKELRANLDNLYPALSFCGKSREQLASWSQSPALLENIKKAFSALNDFSEDWKKGKVSGYTHEGLRQSGLDVGGESDSVAQNPKLRRHREFRLPARDWEKLFFEKHVKLSNCRIHFYPDPLTRQIFIGYVGPHLPTAKF